MPFKFTLLGLEVTSRNSTILSNNEKETTMAKAKKKLTPQQRKFKIAQAKCHKDTDSPKSFGSCMSEKLTKKSNSKKK